MWGTLSHVGTGQKRGKHADQRDAETSLEKAKPRKTRRNQTHRKDQCPLNGQPCTIEKTHPGIQPRAVYGGSNWTGGGGLPARHA